jgi:predicted Zn-dependent protease
VERVIRDIAAPVFRAAGLDSASVRLFIVADPAINAFVAGGSNIFLHTGLLMAAEEPEMLAGVLAHETGHITGGHLARGAEQLEQASIGAVLSYIVGAGAILAGAGDVGAAVLSGASSAANRSLLSFSRTNEQAADAAALRFLEEARISPRGMLKVFRLLQRHEKQHYGTPDPYALTHPLTRERVNQLRDYLSERPEMDVRVTVHNEINDRYARMIGKLEGFLEEPDTVLARYRDAAVPTLRSRYAVAVARFRRGDTEEAVASLRGLIAEAPGDAYYHDTLGQVLFESGRVAEAAEIYGTAVALAPDEAMIQTGYAQALLASAEDDAAWRGRAIRALELATRQDATFGLAWRLLAGAYGADGNTGMRHLALAEEALLDNKPEAAVAQSDLAVKALEQGSPARLRASDLHREAVRELAKKKEGESSPFFH